MSAKVLLRWGLQCNVVVLSKSTHRERIEENAQIFDFTLGDEDMRLSMRSIGRGHRLNLGGSGMAKLVYACVLTRNIERLAAFYRLILGVDPDWSGSYAEFATGPGGIFSLWAIDAYAAIAGPVAASEFGTGAIMLEFQVDDVDAEFTRLQHLADFRIDFIIPPTTMAWGNRSIYFRDPDGNLLNLFTVVKDQATSR